MARTTRMFLPGMPLHVIQRAANRQPCFFDANDCHWYLGCLEKHCLAQLCSLHAYVLMTNHVHFLLSANSVENISQLMKSLAQEYAHYINWRRHRTGPLWDGRFKSCVVQDATYLLICQRYIECNPVRAGMVAYPGHYRWSSYRCNAEGRDDALVTPHPVYMGLGLTRGERQQAYGALFHAVQDEATLERLRHAGRSNGVIGSSVFMHQIQTRKA